MHIVIEIPEGVKKAFDNANKEDFYGCYYDFNSVIGKAIKNGTPLPKGHGRLIDADAIEIDLHNKAFNNAGSKKYYEIVWAYKQIHNAQTIIEADKEVDE